MTNWKFVFSWVAKFVLSMVVYHLSVYKTGSLWLGFAMALGFLILIAVAEFYIKLFIERWKEKH